MDREALFKAMEVTAAQKPTPVDMPGWPQVYVRSQTVAEVDSNIEEEKQKGGKRNTARNVARILCDENGKLICDPDNDKDVDRLARQPWPLLYKLLEASNAAVLGTATGN